MYPLIALAMGSVALYLWIDSRGDNSAIEDEPAATTTRGVATDVSELTEALGWPYFFGSGGPSTAWEDGENGVDCSGFVQIALVRLGLLSEDEPDRGASDLANWCVPIAVGEQEPGDLAYYPGHVMIVVSNPDANGNSQVMGASGGDSTTFGDDENACVKLFSTQNYRSDFVTFMRLPGLAA